MKTSTKTPWTTGRFVRTGLLFVACILVLSIVFLALDRNWDGVVYCGVFLLFVAYNYFRWIGKKGR